MAKNIEVNGESKQLRDCTLADLDSLAGGAAPSAPTAKEGVTTEGNYAKLAEVMRGAGAATVADLGEQKVERWEVALDLGLAGSGDFFQRALKKDGANEAVAKEEVEPEDEADAAPAD
ncbi:MAG: hypothetical protein JWL77_7157 [Chthonomonadaceae bacterium]|nr:hypothetical protein [Chthonomonadaceae bacterium]